MRNPLIICTCLVAACSEQPQFGLPNDTHAGTVSWRGQPVRASLNERVNGEGQSVRTVRVIQGQVEVVGYDFGSDGWDEICDPGCRSPSPADAQNLNQALSELR